jgi:sugar phosphate isomerase/epimerase
MYKNLNVQSLGISGQTSETIELTLSFGFKALDLDIVELAQRVEEEGLPKARRLIDSAKLRVGSFTLPFDLEAEEPDFRKEIERLPALARVAADMGCTRAVTSVAPANDRRPMHENFELYRKRLAEICKLLEPLNIRLGVGYDASHAARQGKTFQFIADLNTLLMLLGMVGAKNLGVAVDVWHVYLSSDLDKLSKLTPAQLVTLDLSDAPAGVEPGSMSDEQRLLPGETGVIDLVAILGLFADKGYDGPVTPKAGAERFAGMRRDAIVKLAGQQLDQVWKAAGLSPAGKLVAVGK